MLSARLPSVVWAAGPELTHFIVQSLGLFLV